jgi:aryl-phospho-beta-D-glucosidase BglC (GH1 family)
VKHIESLSRREFVKRTGVIGSGLLLGANSSFARKPNAPVNRLPKWKGFNLLDFYSPDPSRNRRGTPEEYFKWMEDWGFDFIRIPLKYPGYLKFDRSKDITPEEVRQIDPERTDKIEELVYLAHKYHMHVSINLHRAPGYCVNAGFHEPYNLWKDQQALDDFCFHWDFWARRFKNVSREKISFDLLNEPSLRDDMNDQHGSKDPVPGDLYRKLVIAGLETIRKVNPDHLVIADGNHKGKLAVPEIADLDVGQSCRGYVPGIISHYKASWAYKDPDSLPEPKWPGQVGDQYLSRAMLEELYQPWIELLRQGVGVHCGECGCYNKTPHHVFLAWFEDVLDILSENGIGFALWEFRGSFGIINSGRTDIEYEDWYGVKLDRKYLELLQKY